MNYNKQIKHLWGIPSYRLRLLFFVVLGTTAILASLLIQDAYWQGLLSNFAVTFAAVGVIDFMWDILGGEPMEAAMRESFAEVNQRMDALNQSLGVVADLTNSHIGIERIWSERRNWETDKPDGISAWKKRVCQAKQVDIVSNTFYTAWAHDNNFLDELLEAVNRGTKFRLVIYDPDSEILQIRSENEDDPKMEKTSEMKMEIHSTLDKIKKKISKLDKNARNNFEIRLNSRYYQMAQIIRADKRILVALYLSKKSGSYCPTLQILGPDSSLFEAYAQQFEILWAAGKPFETKVLKSPSK
ncbi:MAG TPA: hypothetical protein VFQ13_21425 [Anaerolineales bacterium]|nr:hypothetical protein [Anaerolineales bacterium]